MRKEDEQLKQEMLEREAEANAQAQLANARAEKLELNSQVAPEQTKRSSQRIGNKGPSQSPKAIKQPKKPVNAQETPFGGGLAVQSEIGQAVDGSVVYQTKEG